METQLQEGHERIAEQQKIIDDLNTELISATSAKQGLDEDAKRLEVAQEKLCNVISQKEVELEED